MDIKKAVLFNERRIALGKLTPEHIANLVEFFQSGRGLDDDGMAGDDTISEIAKYVLEQSPPPPVVVPVVPKLPLEDWYWPLPAINGARPRISNKFGASRDDGTRRHAGSDVMYRRAKRGTPKKPEYLADWYVTSDPETPLLACGPGHVAAAGWGTAINGEKILVVTIDHHNVPGIGPMAMSYLHCARALVSKGDAVVAGQPIAICGHSATDINHLHFEVWLTSKGDRRHDWQVDPAPYLAQMKYKNMVPTTGKFDPTWLTGELPRL